MTGGLGMTWTEAIMIYFNMLSQNLLGKTNLEIDFFCFFLGLGPGTYGYYVATF